MTIDLDAGYCVRELRAADAEALFDLMNRPETMRYLPDRFDSIEEMREVTAWLRSNYGKRDYIRLTYAIARGDELAGWVSVGPLPSDETKRELAYCVLPEAQGRGLAGRSAAALIARLREDGLAGELWAEVDADNAASIRVLRKCGFAPAGETAADEGGRTKLLFSADYEAGRARPEPR